MRFRLNDTNFSFETPSSHATLQDGFLLVSQLVRIDTLARRASKDVFLAWASDCSFSSGRADYRSAFTRSLHEVSTIVHGRIAAPGSALPRVDLALLPTPLEEVPRFTECLGGVRIFLKRDDYTGGMLFSGNKTRHNEFILADALRQGSDVIVWGAGVQSNNCRQTAAACAAWGSSADCFWSPITIRTSRETCSSTTWSGRKWRSSMRRSVPLSTSCCSGSRKKSPCRPKAVRLEPGICAADRGHQLCVVPGRDRR